MPTIKQIPVFLSSPGDVAEERQRALAVIDRLNAEPEFASTIQLSPVAWDRKGGEVPMQAGVTPQEAINQGLRKPSACAIVVVIFWSRMGTPLPENYLKPDGSRYLSGTEWEYLDGINAFNASTETPKVPCVVVYRRTETPTIGLDDPEFDTKREQYQRVQTFFKQFTNADGAITGGVNNYPTPDEFERLLTQHLRYYREQLKDYDPFDLSAVQRREQEQRAAQSVANEAQRNANRPKVDYAKVVNSLPQSDMVERFRDRSAQQAEIVNALVEGTPLVSVYGRGGIGKTALVCKVLGDLQRDQAGAWNGMVYLGAGSQSSTGISLERIVSDLMKTLPPDVREPVDAAWRDPKTSPHQKAAALINALINANGRYVLLLDNMETLQDPVTHKISDPEVLAFFETLFERGCERDRGLRVLATSREQFDFTGLRRIREKRVPLLDGLPVDDAVTLLVDLDTDNEASIRDNATNSAVRAKLATIAEKTHGVPRALEAIVALLRSPRMTLDGVLTDPALLSGKVNELIAEAIRRLDADSLRVMEALAVYGRPLSQAGLEFLLASYMDIAILPGLLDRLVSGYFVSFNKATLIYSLHPIDRDFCRERVPEGSADDADVTPLPFTRYALLSRAAEYHRKQRLPQDQWKTIADLAPQLLEFEYRVEMGDYNAAADLLTDIDFDYLLLWGYALRVIAMHEALQGKITESSLAQYSVGNLGTAYRDTGRILEAIACYEKALASAREDKDQWNEGVWLGSLGGAYNGLGKMQTTIDYYGKALVIAREIGDRRGEGARLGNLGIAYRALGQMQMAIDYYQQALVIAREIEDRRNEGIHLSNLGNAYRNLGQAPMAIDYYQQTLVIAREIGNRGVEGNVLGNLGFALAQQGDTNKGIANLRQALTIFRDIQDILSVSGKTIQLAEALMLAGDLDGALTAIVEACEIDVPDNNHNAAAIRGLIEARLGKRDAAHESFEKAVGFADTILSQTPGYYTALYARGLARAGLALVVDAALDPAIADYQAARAICDAAGVVSEARMLLEQLMQCPGGERLAGALVVLG